MDLKCASFVERRNT